ncbi:MAG: hypothetical protein DBX59_05020 [Bacillota bacterium]|nr:MAG: hypothetical protein DBX59_05020 [Bacillota bacterium]
MLPEKTAEEVKEKVEVLPELFGKQETAKLTAQCDYIENLYANLSEEEKETVDNYQKLSVTRSKILAIENDVEIEENKVIYFDSVLGEKQVNASLSAGNMNDSVKKSTDYEIKNLDEKASTKISLNVDGACDLKITFLSPMLINLTENQGLGLYVYTEKENLVAWMDDTSWNNNHLSVGQWTFVYVRDLSYIKNNGLINYSFNIVSPGTGDRPNWSLPQGKYDVYLSSVFVFDKGYADSLLKQEKTDANMLSIAADIYSALNIPQTDIFGTTFNQLLNQISSDSGKEELKNLIDLSDKITTEKNEEKLESIKIRYFELVYGLTYQKNTMVYSGSEYGLSQIQLNVLADTQSGYNAGDFSVGISDEKKYNNKPTLKLDIKNTQGYQIDLTITNSMLKDISEYSSISFYVYTEEDDYVAVGEKTLSSWENNRLTPRKWNKVVINNFDNLSAGSKTNIDGFKMMFVWYRSWAKLHSNTTFYISDIIAEK